MTVDAMPATDWLPGDPWQRFVNHPMLLGYYEFLTGFVRNRPEIRSVVEIGTRTGYAMAAFLRGNPRLDYLGIDSDGGPWEGVHGGLEHAISLAMRYNQGMVELRQCPSQALDRLPRQFDLAYIDGNHDEAYVRHDLTLCAAWCRMILCDDFAGVQACPGVTAAVNAFGPAHGWSCEVLQGRWALLRMS